LRYRLKSDDLELVTIMETVCADGTTPIPPLLMFQGVQFLTHWFDENVDDVDYCVATTERGWTSDEMAVKWFEHCFLPAAKAHADPAYPIVL
ncbi:hypothetical protein FISHEDRAFT_10248, partial [Fistulina hepatica ATCC 64428]